MNEAIASNWVAETCEATQTGFKLKGSSRGYTTFQRAFSVNTQVFYSAHDDRGNREAGYATFNGLDLENRQATATLYNGIYQDKSPQKIEFTGTLTIACTFNAVAFNTLWKALNSLGLGDNIEIPPELVDGLVAALDSKADVSDLEAEIRNRIAADQNLQDQIDSIDVGGGGGAGMVISATEPDDPVDGMQWLDSTTAIVWIWDDGKWLEFPSATINTDVIGEEGETVFQGHLLKLTAKPTRDDEDDDDRPEGGRIVATGASVLGEVNSLEQIVFGGIVFPGADAEKPDGFPKAGERSVQPAMAIAHESLGITYQLDKEGVVRANDFADVAGNPLMRIVTQDEYDALTPNEKTVYFII